MSIFEESHRLRLAIKQFDEPLRELAETQRLHSETLRELFDRQKQLEASIKPIEVPLIETPLNDVMKSFEASMRAIAALQESIDTQRKFHENYQAHIAQSIEAQKRIKTALKRITVPYIPELQRINSFAKDLARHVESYKAALPSIPAWESSLATRMRAIKTPWVLPDFFDKPMIGFARLSRLSDAAHTAEPYSTPVAELVAAELGNAVEFLPGQTEDERDAKAMEAGLNPELIAFPPAAYCDVVCAAGFRFRITPMAVPQAVESRDIGAVPDPKHWQMLTELERLLRHTVEKALTKLAGPNWIEQRVPQNVCRRWKRRQEKERTAGRPVYSPIQYADFMDLADVIGQPGNWEEAFQPIFRNQEDFHVSLCRLHPVRNAIAHSRPLGRADVLTLVSEATRIFSALGIRVLD